MSETFPNPRRVLHLVVAGLSPARMAELQGQAPEPGVTTEIFVLNEANAREALEKIFAADGIAVWGEV